MAAPVDAELFDENAKDVNRSDMVSADVNRSDVKKGHVCSV
jgi:hypothetical protein